MEISSNSLNEFEIQKKLGDGSFSSVYRVVRKSDGHVYALKQVQMTMLTQKEKTNALNEIRILASIKDPYIIGYKEAFYDNDSSSLCIIMQLAAGGDLLTLIKEGTKKNTPIDESQIWVWLIQMVKALKTLHDMKIIHRDLKCANIFLSEGKENIKLGDLNVSQVNKRDQMARTQTGTPYYASPQIWKDQPYNYQCDVWSMGCVLYELATYNPPFKANDMEGLYKKITKGSYDKLPSRYSSDLASVISQCLQLNQTLRPDCDQLLKSPAIAKRLTQFNNNENVLINNNIFTENALISTIKVPRDLQYLKDRLPKPSYGECNRSFDLPRPRSSHKQYRQVSVETIPNDNNLKPLVKISSKENGKPPMYGNNLQTEQEQLVPINRPLYSGRQNSATPAIGGIRQLSPRLNSEEVQSAKINRKPLQILNNIVYNNCPLPNSHSCNGKLPTLQSTNTNNQSMSGLESTPVRVNNKENALKAIFYEHNNKNSHLGASPRREPQKNQNSILCDLSIFEDVDKKNQRKISLR